MSARLRFAEVESVSVGETGKSCSFTQLRFYAADRDTPAVFLMTPGRPGDLLLIIGHSLYQDDNETPLGVPTGWYAMEPGSPVLWRYADGSITDQVLGITRRGAMVAHVRGAAPAGTGIGYYNNAPLYTISGGGMNNEGPNWTVDMSGHTIRNRVYEAGADLLVGGLSIIYALGSTTNASWSLGLKGLHPGWPQPDASEYKPPHGEPNPYFAVMFNDPWYATYEWPYTTMFCARPLDTTNWPGPRFDGVGNESFFEPAQIYIGWIVVQPWWNAESVTVLLDGVEVEVPMAVDSSPAVGDILWIAQEGRRMYGIGHTPAPSE